MISFLLFTSVFVVFYTIECIIEHFIFGSTNAKYNSAIQSEQRNLLEAHRILNELEVTLEAVSPPAPQKDYQTTTNEFNQEKIYNTVLDNTSLVVYNPSVETTSFFPLVYFGFVVGVFVLVFLVIKWIDETEREQNKISDDCDSDVFEGDCVEHLKESYDEGVFEDCLEELGNELCVSETDVYEEWFDACAELSDGIQIDVFEDCVDEVGKEWIVGEINVSREDYVEEVHKESIVGEINVSREDYVDEVGKESSDVVDTGLFIVSDKISSADENEGVLIAFGEFTMEQTKEFMETSNGFVLSLPQRSNEHTYSKHANHSKKEEKRLVKGVVTDEPGLVFTFDIDDTPDETLVFGRFSLEETQSFLLTRPLETTMSNHKEKSNDEKRVEENKDKNVKNEKEAGINTFKTDLQISQTTNVAPSYRHLQTWEPEKDDETADLEYLEKEDEDLKGETILSPEEMYRLNPDVQSTFLEDLSQYTTELDLSSFSKEEIEFAEKMANEILKENKQRKNKKRRRNFKQKYR